MSSNWYAVYTKPQSEKKVAAILTKKKIENRCLCNRIINNAVYRKKVLHAPLFPGFVFVYITEAEMFEVRKISDVINFVYWLGKPAVIKNAEIENATHFSDLYNNIKVEKTSVNTGGMVRITNEPGLDVLHSGVLTVKKAKIKLTLPSLGFVMTAEIEKAVEPYRKGIENLNTGMETFSIS